MKIESLAIENFGTISEAQVKLADRGLHSCEKWLPVVGFEKNYSVSNFGNVVSTRTNFGNPRWRPLKIGRTHDGYGYVCLSKDGVSGNKKVHHLVLEAFVGPRPNGLIGIHLNDDGSDNRLENLKWGTPDENYAMRSMPIGEGHYQAKISLDTAKEIKRRLSNGERGVDIAADLSINVRTVYNIKHGSAWRDS